jgi:hypothetical protein
MRETASLVVDGSAGSAGIDGGSSDWSLEEDAVDTDRV